MGAKKFLLKSKMNILLQHVSAIEAALKGNKQNIQSHYDRE
jgi:hypothetical protein